jgi:glycosyltransferase involved in cell wall biosynthesis
MIGADKVIVLSKGLREVLIQLGVAEDQLVIVPNGVDSKIFCPREKHPQVLKQYGLEDKIVIGFIGSIRRIEGLSLLIKNLHQIIDRFSNIRVLLVGDGNEVVYLKKMVTDRKIDAFVTFTGRVDHDRILDYYSVVDIFIYPRIDARVNHKVTPLKPLEAMAMEKAVVASDVGGLSELVAEGENGLLFRTEDGDHLVRRCLDLIENPSFQKQMAKRARDWIVRNRDWSNVIKLYSDVYSELL